MVNDEKTLQEYLSRSISFKEDEMEEDWTGRRLKCRYFNNCDSWKRLVPKIIREKDALFHPYWDPKKHNLKKKRLPEDQDDGRYLTAVSYC